MVLMEKNGRKEIVWPGRKQLDFPRIVQKWESMGKNRGKSARKVSGVEDKWVHMGTGNEM